MSLPTETWLLLFATTVPFLAVEAYFFVRFGRWLRKRKR